MEKEHNETAKEQDTGSEEKKITRKEAIKKTGYMALSAATMMILLNKKAKACPETSTAQSTTTDDSSSGGSDGFSSWSDFWKWLFGW